MALIVVIMGPGKKHFAEMCLDSVKDADKILYWTSANNLVDENELTTFSDVDFDVFYNEWDEVDPATNGKCRQRYLEYLKQNYPDDWCLVLDEDEVLSENGIEKLKEFIQIAKTDCYNIHMRHFIGDLGHEDNSLNKHWVPGRLFKISEPLKYQEHSHPLLEMKDDSKIGNLDLVTIWHLGHLPVEYMDYILKRYKQHINDSQIHPKEYLNEWKNKHFFGEYSTKKINILELPEIIKKRYEIDQDEFYFAFDDIEGKHPLMVEQWYDYFKPKSIIDIGCGKGNFLHFWTWFVKDCMGVEISKYAIEHSSCKRNLIKNCDLLNFKTNKKYDLAICFDVLEHINYDNIDKAINILKKCSNNILVSIAFAEDPNWARDITHKIKENKEWWINKFKEHKLKYIKTPDNFLYKEQILIFKNDK